ncbi:MAG TPA: hypothetical protein VNZ54_02960 [bacterium]|nr:hypothetical protein [bacterium]
MPTHRPLLRSSSLPFMASLAAAAGLLFLFFHLGPLDGAVPGARCLLRNVHVVDLDGGPDGAPVDLLWQDGLLRAVSPKLDPAGAKILDGRGAWVLPAPADAGVFLSLEGRLPGDSVPAEAGQSLRLQGGAGVGLLLDLNAHRSFMASARALPEPKPRLLFAGALFTAPGGWRLSGQTPWNSHLVEVIEAADLDAPWQRLLRFGDQAVFASVEHEGRDDLAIPLPVLQELGRRAREQGLPFIIQVQHHAKALLALQARPTALLGPLIDAGDDTALARALVAGRCDYLPALGSVLNAIPGQPLENWQRGFPASTAVDVATLSQATDPDRAEQWVKHWTRQEVDPAQVLAVPAVLAANGATLALATGSGLPLVFHGVGLQAELAWLSRAGLSQAQVLAAVCVNSRALLGQGAGRVAAGQPADLLLLKANPMDDPSAMEQVQALYVAGEEVPR